MNEKKSRILSRITCPHCWHKARPHEIKWVAAHPNLRDDPKIPDGQRRFLPTHFELSGQAVDSLGEECSEIACPRCHLIIPRDLVELPPTFFSILGSPSSGKSYFLSSSLWSLRTTLSRQFAISFEDSDPVANQKLHEYEETLFVNSRDDRLVALPKTELDGDLYEQVEIEHGRTMLLPRAFVFRMRLTPDHPRISKLEKNGRAICLYDNAGEHFLPGAQTANAPGTRHLAISKALLFIFDPTQHPQFRKACRGRTADPQVGKDLVSFRQDHILAEATRRIRGELGLGQDERDRRPLIVVLSKYDAWASLAGNVTLKRDWIIRELRHGFHALNVQQLKTISDRFRDLMLKLAPEIVSTSEAFSEDVIYIPVSALGCSPRELPGAEPVGDPPRLPLGVLPGEISPIWSEVPLLYAIQKTMPGMIGTTLPVELAKQR
ncbi:MAG: hypothetical protein RIK87_24930 [Fuerstiella sp.]